MGTTLHTLRPPKGAVKRRTRVGRGHSSGRGETAGKGVKGQKARTGHHGARVGFEGGQMPMQRRLPKRGFKNPFREEYCALNVGTLAKRFPAGAMVDVDAMKAAGLIPRRASTMVKVLGEGDVGHGLVVRAHAFSKAATDKLAAAGGAAELVAKPRRAANRADGVAAPRA